MSKRIEVSWTVFVSVENSEHDRCVDIFSRPDGSYGFEEFRRDVEDGGQWTPVQFYSGVTYVSCADALDSAERCVAWLAGILEEDLKQPQCAAADAHWLTGIEQLLARWHKAECAER